MVLAVAVELAHRRVEGDGDVLAGREAGLGDRLDEDRDGILVGRQVGSEAAFVADGGRQTPVVEQRLERVIRLDAPAQRLAVARRADRHHHELLEVDRVVGVGAAVDHVHHRHRQDMGVDAADVAVQRHAELVGRRLGDRQADAEDGVGAEAALVLGAVELVQHRVDRALRRGIEALEGGGDLTVDVADGLADALAAVALAAVAQLDRLVLAGGRAARHGGAPGCAGVEGDLDLDGGVAPRVEDLAADDFDDLTHGGQPIGASGPATANCETGRPHGRGGKADGGGHLTTTVKRPPIAAPRMPVARDSSTTAAADRRTASAARG